MNFEKFTGNKSYDYKTRLNARYIGRVKYLRVMAESHKQITNKAHWHYTYIYYHLCI